MSSWLECLQCKGKDLSFYQKRKKAGVATGAPVSTVPEDGLETDHRGSLASCPAKVASSEVSGKPCLKRMRQREGLFSGLCRARCSGTHRCTL